MREIAFFYRAFAFSVAYSSAKQLWSFLSLSSIAYARKKHLHFSEEPRASHNSFTSNAKFGFKLLTPQRVQHFCGTCIFLRVCTYQKQGPVNDCLLSIGFRLYQHGSLQANGFLVINRIDPTLPKTFNDFSDFCTHFGIMMYQV